VLPSRTHSGNRGDFNIRIKLGLEADSLAINRRDLMRFSAGAKISGTLELFHDPC
jgi:hypothetical protein